MRRHFIPEPELAPDEDELALQHTLDCLGPIRDHRLGKSQRAYRKEQQKLRELEQRHQEQVLHLETKKIEQVAQKKALNDHHQGRPIDQSTLHSWIGEERELLAEIEQLKQTINQLKNALEQQAEQVKQAKLVMEQEQQRHEKWQQMQQWIKESL